MGMGNAGQELQVVRIMRDLEQRIEDSWDFLWGETGDTVGSMRWEEVTLWLAAMGAPHEAIQVQQREQHNGQDIEDYLVSSNNDSEGIQKVMNMFGVPRKMAMRLYMNMRLRRKKAKQAEEGVQRSVLATLQELVGMIQEHPIQEMRVQGFGRYHGAAALASKFASNRGVDVLVRIAAEADDETATAALWALVLVSDAQEERPAEASRAEAAARFDARKLVIKAGGIRVLLEVVESRPDDAVQLALHVLKSVLVFPGGWIGTSGTAMGHYYESGTAALLAGGLPVLVGCLSPSRGSNVRELAVEVLRELLLSDDVGAARHAAGALEEDFFNGTKPRSRAATAERPVSNTRMNIHRTASHDSSRTGSSGSQRSHASRPSQSPGRRSDGVSRSPSQRRKGSRPVTRSSSRPGSPAGPTAGATEVENRARDALVDSGALDVMEKILTERHKIPGKLVLSSLQCKNLPRVDKLGDSDPYLRIFVEGKEAKTEVIEDNLAPIWDDSSFTFDIEDTGCAEITLMVFDWNQYDAHRFMSLASLHLADVVSNSLPAEEHRARRTNQISESELLNKIKHGERELPSRKGEMVTLDDWLDLRQRNGQPPALRGILGALHLRLKLSTQYEHDIGHLSLMTAVVDLLTVLVSNPAFRGEARTAFLRPTIELLLTPSEHARASAAALLGILGADLNFAHTIVAYGGSEILLRVASFGSPATQLCAMQALGVLALHPSLHDSIVKPTGQLAASADLLTPILDIFQDKKTTEDVFGATVGFVANLCYGNERFQETVMKSPVPLAVMLHMWTQRAGARAEGACMIAILAESEMNRRHLSMISGHNGVIAFNMVECLSEVLCSKNTVTDSRGIDGMRSCQAASASALAFLSRFGGMDRLVQVLKTAETDVQILAASALAQIADMSSERDRLVETGIATELVEMIVLARSPRARLVATQCLARVSDSSELEPTEDIIRRIRKVCVFIPRFGVSAVDSVVNIVLRSTDELQRAAAAQALAAWVRCRDFAEEIWAKGSELIIDLLHVDAAMNSNGLYYAVQALVIFGLCEHGDLRKGIALAEVSAHGVHRSVLGGLRYAVRDGDLETALESVVALHRLIHDGAMEVMIDVLVTADSTPKVLKALAMVLQPLCAKPHVRAAVSSAVGVEPENLGVWMAKFMFISAEDEARDWEIRTMRGEVPREG